MCDAVEQHIGLLSCAASKQAIEAEYQKLMGTLDDNRRQVAELTSTSEELTKKRDVMRSNLKQQREADKYDDFKRKADKLKTENLGIIPCSAVIAC